MNEYKTEFINDHTLKFDSYILGIDIGGTHTNLCVAGIENNNIDFLFKFNFKTEELDNIINPINKILNHIKEKYNIEIKKACIGVPGVVSEDNNYAELTNISWNLLKEDIIKKTNLEKILLLNDFQCIGFGLNVLNDKDIIEIKSGKIVNNKTKAIVGAGSGLGKTILFFNKKLRIYIPLDSEGGHADFPVYDSFELDLINWLKGKYNIKEKVTYEDLLSGKGLENIYNYISEKMDFKKNEYYYEIKNSKEKASIISKYKETDDACKKTFELFLKFYARCLKNFALETLCTSGLYIAGGISIKNKDIFKKEIFKKEFESAYKKNKILKEIPIYLINNYDVSIFGACIAGNHLIK